MLYIVFGLRKNSEGNKKKRNRKTETRGKKNVEKEKVKSKKKNVTQNIYVVRTYRESKRFVYYYQSSNGQSDWLTTKMHQEMQQLKNRKHVRMDVLEISEVRRGLIEYTFYYNLLQLLQFAIPQLL